MDNNDVSASTSDSALNFQVPPKIRRGQTASMYCQMKSLPTPYQQRLPKPVWVISHHSQKELAQAVVGCCQKWQNNALKIGWDSQDTRKVEYKDILEWDNFGDGFPNLFIKDVKEMAGKDVIFIASFHSVDIIFEQISMMYMIPRYLANSVTVILPYFPTGTMERVDLEGQVATAKTLSTMLSAIPSSARGPSQIMIYDIHALQERFYFSHNIVPRLETAIPLLIRELERTFHLSAPPSATSTTTSIKNNDNNGEEAEAGEEMSTTKNGEGQILENQSSPPQQLPTVAFPDEGAAKRFRNSFPRDWPTVICTKTRSGDKRYIRVSEGDPNGADVILVDDLVQSGGTLLESARVLRQMGANSVSAYVTHAVFPKNSWKKFTQPSEDTGDLMFGTIWITDSIPHAREIARHEPFKLLSLAPGIAESLLGFDLRIWDS